MIAYDDLTEVRTWARDLIEYPGVAVLPSKEEADELIEASEVNNVSL